MYFKFNSIQLFHSKLVVSSFGKIECPAIKTKISPSILNGYTPTATLVCHHVKGLRSRIITLTNLSDDTGVCIVRSSAPLSPLLYMFTTRVARPLQV